MTLAVVVTLQMDIHAVLAVFGVWAGLSGFLQLATAVRRWRTVSGQWPMILSGAQSAFAGIHSIQKALSGMMPTSAAVAPYAAFGALYFSISAISLAVAAHSRKSGSIT